MFLLIYCSRAVTCTTTPIIHEKDPNSGPPNEKIGG